MNCHSQIFSNSPFLEPVRDSFRTGRSIQWTRVHDLPDFVYFNHSIHVNKGVGCTTCHGQVDRMPLMWQEQSLQMEWCLDCHRNPERYVRPREAVFRVDYVPPANQARARRAGWSPNTRFRSSRAARHVTDDTDADPFWRTLDELADDPAFRERLYNEFPSEIEAIADPVARRTFLKLMGASLAPGRRHRLHAPAAGKNRPLRAPARRDHSRQAALLRDGHAARRRRDRPARRKPRRTADEDRRQPAASRQPRRDRRLRAGGGARPLRSRSIADADERRRDPSLVGVPRRDARGAHGAAAARRRRPPHPHRIGQLADAGRADSRSAAAISRRRSGTSGIRRAATTRARARSSLSAATSTTQYPDRSRRRHPGARRRLSRLRPGRPPLRARLRRAAPSRAGRSHEPALCDRKHADVDRLARRSSTGAQTQRDRSGGPARAGSPHGRAAPAWTAAGSASPRRQSGSMPSPRISRRIAAPASSSPATASRPPFTRSRTR